MQATTWPGFAAFAGGFVVGNYLGRSLEQRLAIGSVLVRVITSRGQRRDWDIVVNAAGCVLAKRLDGDQSALPVRIQGKASQRIEALLGSKGLSIPFRAGFTIDFTGHGLSRALFSKGPPGLPLPSSPKP